MWDSNSKNSIHEGVSEVDAHECHPISGKFEVERLYTHLKYNMVWSVKIKNGKIIEQTKLEVEPKKTETKIYSDVLAHVEDWRGACAVIVNKKGKHFVATRALAQDRWKNSYRKEL